MYHTELSWFEDERPDYRDAGVREYGIIDRFRRTLTVYQWRGTRRMKRTVGEEDVYRAPLLPGFELPLRNLFAVAGKYSETE